MEHFKRFREVCLGARCGPKILWKMRVTLVPKRRGGISFYKKIVAGYMSEHLHNKQNCARTLVPLSIIQWFGIIHN